MTNTPTYIYKSRRGKYNIVQFFRIYCQYYSNKSIKYFFWDLKLCSYFWFNFFYFFIFRISLFFGKKKRKKIR